MAHFFVYAQCAIDDFLSGVFAWLWNRECSLRHQDRLLFSWGFQDAFTTSKVFRLYSGHCTVGAFLKEPQVFSCAGNYFHLLGVGQESLDLSTDFHFCNVIQSRQKVGAT